MLTDDVACHGCGHPRATTVQRCLRCRATTLAAEGGPFLAAHADRVASLALAVADALGLDEQVRLEVEAAALLHDVGKRVLPQRLLSKPAPLDEEEWAIMRTHTVEGERLVVEGRLPSALGRVVRASHERWDGAGYPDGLRGEAIPLAARVVFCADAYDAMTSRRPYRRPLGAREAVEQLRDGAGRQFDPVVARLLAELVERLGEAAGSWAAVAPS